MGTMVNVERILNRLGVRVVHGQPGGLVHGMVLRVRLEVGCGMVTDLFIIASLVLARTRRIKVPG